jgi:hypothetical protein
MIFKKRENKISKCFKLLSQEVIIRVMLLRDIFLEHTTNSVSEEANVYLMENMRYNNDSHTTKRLYYILNEAAKKEVKLRGAILLCKYFDLM